MSRDDRHWSQRVFRLPATRQRARAALDEELHFHIEGRIEELMSLGHTRTEAEAEARREEAAARFNELQAKVLAEIERAVEVFRVSESNSATLQSLSSDQEKQRASVEAQLKAGAVEQLDFVNAQLESAVSQLVLLDGQVKLQQAIGTLESAVQRPLDAATVPPPATFNPRQNSPPPDKEKETKP